MCSSLFLFCVICPLLAPCLSSIKSLPNHSKKALCNYPTCFLTYLEVKSGNQAKEFTLFHSLDIFNFYTQDKSVTTVVKPKHSRLVI